MKKFLSLSVALLFFQGFIVNAQTYVTIPDANFSDWLNVNYPDCMDGNQLDIDCPAVLNTTSVNVQQKSIADLTGIEYFTSLKFLNCSFNQLSFLPTLPEDLVLLNCLANQLSSLPELPDSLKTLNVSSNPLLLVFSEWPPMLQSLTLSGQPFQLSDFPPLPNTLTTLSLQHCQLTELPPLPPNLNTLFCGNNPLGTLPPLPSTLKNLAVTNCSLSDLPATLPASLTGLLCDYNNLTSLPQLPAGLLQLHCNNNQLIELPALPDGISTLILNHNNLTSLPELPSALTFMECYDNQLSSLPELPPSLHNLYCQNNLLTALPELPTSILVLNCTNNLISCFDPFPHTLASPNIEGNPFTCLPNYIPGMGPLGLLVYPLCEDDDLLNNPLGCTSAKGVGGFLYSDENADCELSANDPRMLNVPILLFDDQEEQVAATWSLSEGLYFLSTDTATYTLRIDTTEKPYQAACLNPGVDTLLSFSTGNELIQNLNFGLECKPGHDVGVRSILRAGWVFPGQTHTLKVVAGDLSGWYGLDCASGVSGKVSITISGPVAYAGPAPGALTPNQLSALEFEYNISDFGNIDMFHNFQLLLETDTTAQADEQICVNVLVTPVAGDQVIGNNNSYVCYPVVNSYDPNIKEVWPNTVEVGFDDYFYYTIYFQNTGNAPAFNIRLADTLDSQLDLRSFEVTNYSHPCVTYLHDRFLSFRFNNIMLPDSLSDPEGSIGFVQYRIKAQPDLPVGTVIENTAYIYFDFNDPIITNTTENHFKILTSTHSPQPSGGLPAFPNPSGGIFNLQWPASSTATALQVEVFNVQGKRVLQMQPDSNHWEIDLSSMPAGLYLVRAQSEQELRITRLIKN